MMPQRIAAYVQNLDPRLKIAAAMAMGPGLWLLDPVVVAVFACLLFLLLVSLTASRPLGPKMVRSLLFFVVLWMGVKAAVDLWSGLPPLTVAAYTGVLGLRLAALLMLGLSLSLSASAMSLGMALAWGIRPFAGKERAWRLALSLALMVHFLPLCLSTMTEAGESLSRRCPDCGLGDKMRILPQVVLRNLGQKTWNQTLAVAGRGLDGPDAWRPHFTWSLHDTGWALFALACIVSVCFV